MTGFRHPTRRLRHVPEQFSWVDHALVRQHFIARCEARSAVLYLSLGMLSDAQGLSYYGAVTQTLATRTRIHADWHQALAGHPSAAAGRWPRSMRQGSPPLKQIAAEQASHAESILVAVRPGA